MPPKKVTDLTIQDNISLTDLLMMVDTSESESVAVLVRTLSNLIQPTGVIVPYIGTTAPSGWLICNNTTIGNFGSGATNTGTELYNLYNLIWNSTTGTILGITKGESAESDWLSLKIIRIPDLRGRVPVGNNLGAGVLLDTSNTDIGNTQLNKVGASNITLSIGNIPAHSHTVKGYQDLDRDHQHRLISGDQPATVLAETQSSFSLITSQESGSGTQHSNVQPCTVLNYIVKI